MAKQTNPDHQEIIDFFKTRKEKCTKIVLASEDDVCKNYQCTITTTTGQKETVSVKIQQSQTSEPTYA